MPTISRSEPGFLSSANLGVPPGYPLCRLLRELPDRLTGQRLAVRLSPSLRFASAAGAAGHCYVSGPHAGQAVYARIRACGSSQIVPIWVNLSQIGALGSRDLSSVRNCVSHTLATGTPCSRQEEMIFE
jgi:hypothetical protein